MAVSLISVFFPHTFGVLCEADNTFDIIVSQCRVNPVESRSQAYVNGKAQCRFLPLEMMLPIYGEFSHTVGEFVIGHQSFKRRTAHYTEVTHPFVVVVVDMLSDGGLCVSRWAVPSVVSVEQIERGCE